MSDQPLAQVPFPDLPEGTVTFLFTDIEGSTKLLERLLEQYAILLEDQRQILRSAFSHWNGREIDTQGDAFFAVFPRAIDAVCCVMEAQRELKAHDWPQGAVVGVRMGLHTGEPIQVRTGYVGMDVHRAARIAAAGHGGQALLSQTTRDLVYQDLPKEAALRDLGQHKLKDIRFPQQIYQLEIEGLPVEFPPLKTLSLEVEPPTPGEAPYKGLQYFNEADAAWFFGREQVSLRLANAVLEQHFLAVIGASGSGKSSVVRAGLVPALNHSQPGRWQVHIFTPSSHPLDSLAISLTRGEQSVSAAATLIDDLRRDPRSLHLYIRRTIPQASETEILLVVDQFEELFTQCRDEQERRAFVDNLLYTTGAAGSPCRIVIALRADFYQHLAQYAGLRTEVAKHQEYLGAMEAAELRQAIEEPARRGGWEFSPGLVELMLHDVGATEGHQPEPGALPLLSHALLETWKRRRGNLMNLKAYSEAGGVRGAIAKTAESVFYGELTPEQQQIARNIFLRLTELGEGTQDTRRRALISELVPPAPYGDPKQVEEVLTKLADARLITTSEDSAEVAHEALIREWPTLREWLAQDRESLRTHRHLTEASREWELLERDPGALFRGARLAQAVEWAQANPSQLNVQEQAFLDASQEASEREVREREEQNRTKLAAAQKLAETQAMAAKRLRRRALYLLSALVIAALLAVAAVFFGEQSNRNAQIAGQNLATAQSESLRAEGEALQRATQQAVAEGEANTRATAEGIAVGERQKAEGQRQKAEEQARLAFSRELAAAALSNLTIDPQRSILLAMKAAETADIPEAENALHQAIQASRLRDSIDSGHTDWGLGMDFHPDGDRFATQAMDGTVKIWSFDLESQKISRTALLTITNPISETIRAKTSGNTLHYSPDGSRLAAVSDTYTVKIWDAATGELLHILSGHSGDVYCLAFSPDGNLLVTGSSDKTVRVWDVLTGAELQTLQHDASLMDVAFSPDGSYLATGVYNPTVTVWKRSGQPRFSLSYRFDSQFPEPMRIAFSPDGQQLAISVTGLKIFDLASASAASPPRLKLTLTGASEGSNGLAFSPDGASLISGHADGTIRVWDAVTGQQRYILGGNAGMVMGISLAPDGKHLVSIHDDNSIKLWDLTPSGNQEWLTIGPRDWANLMMISPDGKYLATGAGMFDDMIHIWELSPSGAREIRTIQTDGGMYLPRADRNFTRLVVYQFETDTVNVIDLATGKLLKSISPPPTGEASFPALSPDGSRYAIGYSDGTAVVWDLTNDIQVLKLATGLKYGVSFVGFSPDGKRLVTTDQEILRIWDAEAGNRLLELPSCYYGAAVFSPDGKRLLANLKNDAILYDAQTGQRIATLTGHSSATSGLSFSPDGRYIGVGGLDEVVIIYDAATIQELFRVSGLDVSFTPDGKHLLTGIFDRTRPIHIRGFFLEIEDLMQLARTRLTRTWTPEECQQYLHLAQCPAQ